MIKDIMNQLKEFDITIEDYDLIKKSKYFDSDFYLLMNNDVKESNIDPIIHFLKFGWKEPRTCTKDFDCNKYLKDHIDAIDINPLLHYEKYFKLVEHQIETYKCSIKDYCLIKNSKLFDEKYYLDKYNDVKQAGIDPIIHYLKFGWVEGRLCSDVFDGNEYLILNPDVKRAKVNPLLHYEKLGKRENRLYRISGYNQWIYNYDRISELDVQQMNLMIEGFVFKPLISIVMPVYNTTISWLKSAIDSVLIQTYRNWELIIVNDCSSNDDILPFLSTLTVHENITIIHNASNLGICGATNVGIDHAKGDFIAFFDHDDLLSSYAMFAVAYFINLTDNKVSLLYSDEDKLDENGNRVDPYFKPNFDSVLLEQQNFVAHLSVFRSSIVRQIGGIRKSFDGSQDYDFVLRFVSNIHESDIVHIPFVLYHWRKNTSNSSFSTNYQYKSDNAAKSALIDYLNFKKEDVDISLKDGFVGMWKISRNTKHFQRISIIIPNKNHFDTIKKCVESIFSITTYPNYEIIIVDNGSDSQDVLDYYSSLSDKDVKVIKYFSDEFNYSYSNNLGVSHSTGDFILLLNNDTEVITPNWLEIFLEKISLDNIGAVGARLLYPDRKVQHVGVLLGLDYLAGHPFRFTEPSNRLYFGYTNLDHKVSAVTGACLFTRKYLYEKVGGLDSVNLKISYNDVDFCLKLRTLGLDILYTPYVELIHYESLSRGKDDNIRKRLINYNERKFMFNKYPKILFIDPCYNPNLSIDNDQYTVSNPRISKLWRPWIEMVCPFHRGDVVVALSVALTAVKLGIKVRLHVCKELYDWICPKLFADYFEILPIDSKIPVIENFYITYLRCVELVKRRCDSSNRIAFSCRSRDFSFTALNIVESWYYQLGIPLSTKLTGLDQVFLSKYQSNDYCIPPYDLRNVVLFHIEGGWKLKSFSDDSLKVMIELVYSNSLLPVQIGGKGTTLNINFHSFIFENFNLLQWYAVFKNVKGLVCIDSWSSHFASSIGIKSATYYGSTNERDVSSSKMFMINRNLSFNSLCELSPCNSLSCKISDNSSCMACQGYNITYDNFKGVVNYFSK